ncbi:hypothetical protein EFV37_16740 [Mesorhizobium loti]|nr:hypothetical protein EB229_16735 [Mesorhizobium jarvisii]QKD09669.1 hypothetical protein EFV37_16740 [Mesorhizobium loti]
MVALEHPLLSCRTSPPQGGRLRAHPLSPISSAAKVGRACELPISPLAGEMAGRPEGGVPERGLSGKTAP